MNSNFTEIFKNTYFDDNAVRWVESNNVPTKEVLNGFLENGLITQEQYDKSFFANGEDIAKALEEYVIDSATHNK